MVVHSSGYYYRNLSRNKTVVKTIENLVQLVSEFRDDQQPARLVSDLSDDGELRLAALSYGFLLFFSCTDWLKLRCCGFQNISHFLERILMEHIE